ncbi:MAG: transcription termination factor NusA [Candidatus Levybacteria bacterium]|nr:transcription termination factor NusA [Candidatus Levybacteria bacterium]
MPAVQRSEFLLALNQVANERGVDVEIVLETVKNAILAAYKKDHPDIELEEYSTTLDKNTGEARISHKNKDVTPPGFGRIAAQTARQVILQKIREKEKEAIIADYKLRIGTIVNGMILRFAGPNIIVDVGKTEAMMPIPEQIPNEKYHLNQRLTVYILEIRNGIKGEEIVVSRSNNGLLEGLFKREVPEVSKGSVVIKDIAREAGARSKVAVYSNQQGIDPVGSCVGQRGVRVQAIIAEFGGLEKIDIIQWHENPKDYIAQALSPAKNVRVEIDKPSFASTSAKATADKKATEGQGEKIAHAYVPTEELSLAIGREGQNVRLASKLTGYRIEIEEEAKITEAAEKSTETKKTELSVSDKLSDSAIAKKKVKAEGKKAEPKQKKEKSQIQNSKSETNSNDQNLK